MIDSPKIDSPLNSMRAEFTRFKCALKRIIEVICNTANCLFNFMLSPLFALSSRFTSWIEGKKIHRLSSKGEEQLKENGLALRPEDDKIKDDVSFVELPIINNPVATRDMSEDPPSNEHFLIEEIAKNSDLGGEIFPYELIPEGADRDQFIKKFLVQNPSLYPKLSYTDLLKKEFALLAVKGDLGNLAHVPLIFKQEKELLEIVNAAQESPSCLI